MESPALKTVPGSRPAQENLALGSALPDSLLHRRQVLEYLWQQGISGRILLQKHAEMVDAQLARSFAGCAEAGHGFTLLALGGYGRGELFPFSDVDILLLYTPETEKSIDRVAECILYPLWDAGLEVGHGVRTVAACLDDAEKDYFFRVALLDARLVAGSLSLFSELKERYGQRFVQGRRPDFYAAMQEHLLKRHERFGQHSYMLEPQIKESRGGLRDIHAMLWTAEVIFGLRDTAAMEEAGLLTREERGRLDRAWEELIKIRNRLHYVSGRKNDRLHFEHQEEMAEAFGYRKSAGFLGVERFMRDVYSALQTVAVTTNLFFEHVEEVLGQGQATDQDRLLEPGIELRKGRIHLLPAALAAKKTLLMEVFSQAARTPAPIHYRTRKLIRANLELIDDNFRVSRRVAKSFFALLPEAKDPLGVLAAMLETGLLTAYIPELAEVISLAQHDVYHVYTVDIHLLHTVAELRRLMDLEQNVYNEVRSPHILFLAGLLHDIGKGHGHGHAERGAAVAGVIGKRLGLDHTEQEQLSFLVRDHLFLSHTALRRDLEDEDLIARCARRVETQEKLAMLYLLSIADARATGPSVWNDWKAALLLELYLKIALRLERSDLSAQDQRERARQGAEWVRGKVASLMPADETIDLEVLPDDYLLHFPPEVVADHIRLRAELAGEDLLLRHEDRQEAWSLLIVTKDRTGLLANIFGVLALHNINVLAAQIFTWADGTVVDTFDVDSIVLEEHEAQDWEALRNDLLLATTHRLGLEHRLNRKQPPLRRAVPRIEPRLGAKVVIDNETSEVYSVIEVYAPERMGMLYDITRTLTYFGINIFRAIIGSRADQVVDVFYVLDEKGSQIRAPALQEEIRQSLLHAVSG